MRLTPWMALAAATVFINAACTVDEAEQRQRGEAFAQTPAPAPTLVSVTTTDYAFAAPATIPAGLTTIRLVNQGKEMHHVQVVRLDDGHTMEELMQAAGAHGPIPGWVHFVGGPNVPGPGSFTEATMDLKPGSYALVCFIPSPDGVPHLMKGMVKPLTVQPAESRAEAPVADVRMTLRDYAFEITPEIAAGRRTIRVENAAAQPHEVAVMRLAPGKTAQDVMAWMQTQAGPPPMTLMGGTSLLSTGEANTITAEFEPGEYALFCFVPDAKDGKPHIAHGMVRQLTVR